MKLNVAIVGGGAITDQLYLSYFKNRQDIYNVILVEKNSGRVEELVSKYPYIQNTSSNYMDIIKDVQVGIVALPNFLHFPVSLDFINKGVPVFIEKPIALNYDEGLEIINCAEKLNVPIGVGLVKRFFDSSVYVKKIIESDLLGKVKSVLVSDGNEFAWPLQSDSLVDKKKSGGGVLIDSGAHLLDLICWWLGIPVVRSYADDNCGNVESQCFIELVKDDIQINVELSRLRKLQQKIEIHFEKGILLYSFMNKEPELKIMLESNEAFQFSIKIEDNLRKAFSYQIESFFYHCNFDVQKPGIISEPTTGLDSLKIIQSCYEFRN